jgi:molecular chaperone HtpG
MAEAKQKTDPKGKSQTLKFKTEVAALLDIVINSLYTDREIFVRELISNASDALEKFRHLQLVQKKGVADADRPLEIRIDVDEEGRTFAITDSGIGMTRDEAATNLGTIAHSGSREFLKQVTEGKNVDPATLIGQFGVGFYSAFMAADKVTVHTRSWHEDAEPVVWSSKGAGNFTLRTSDDLPRGTTITVDLKDDADEFSKPETIKSLIKQYSNFVPFPIFVNGEQVNTVAPLWTKPRSEITDEELNEFYRFVGNAFDDPKYSFHFAADAPLAIRALLFVPDKNMEGFGFGRMEPGVSLYCKRVLIQSQVEEILPEYFRFIRGVVDSEDLPLNISRETMQDSALVAKLRRVLTKRLIKFLAEEAGSDAEKYAEFYKEFGHFIKEGVATDHENKDDLAKLLRYESSAEADKLVSLSEYVERMPEGQPAIYYVTGASREALESGPYLEALTERGYEVLYAYESVDDFVMTNLREFDGKAIVSADQQDLKLEESDDKDDSGEKLSESDAGDLASWIKNQLGDAVAEVKPSKRLVKSPAVLVNPSDTFTTGMQKIMQATTKGTNPAASMVLEINPGHGILKRLAELRSDEKQGELASDAAKMLLDNAMIAAGLLVDPKALVERASKMLEAALK